MDNPFVLKPEEYGRDLGVLKHYVRDAATYLQRRTGRPFEDCMAFVSEQVKPGGEMGIEDPDVLSLTRNKYGDREKEVIKLSDYIRDVEQNDRIISPTMAVYHKPEDIPSIASEFISVNVEKRNVSKAQMFDAKVSGDKTLAQFKSNEQKSFKISNNSLSGAQASNGTILYNKSAHSSLTSTCRTATSYGNANNEKFLCGNRHYWSPEIVKGNIVSVINSTNFQELGQVLETYGIRHPTVEETMEVITYSTDLYWKNQTEVDIIRQLVEGLSDIERSAFVYTGDLYHLAKFNDELVRDFLGKLSTKATEPVDDPDAYVRAMDSDLVAFVSLLCSKELAGRTIKELKEKSPEEYGILGATAKWISDVLAEYSPMIQALWRTNTLPASVAHIRSSIRRGVITSDTDSTIFTVQNWTEWYVGQIDFSEKSKAISYAVVYLATQTIAHILAMVSAGMGVRKDHMHTLSMKNEFAFPVFVLTSMAKHYFAYISAQEGNVFNEYDIEIKGVYLKDSNAPAHIMEEFNKALRWTMDSIIETGSVSVGELMKKVATMEKEVQKSIWGGDSFYLTGGQVKEPSAYANPTSSPYVFYEMWEAVFAPKYSAAPLPPYSAVKVSVDLNNQTKIKEWLSDLADPELAERMTRWLRDNNKTTITSMLLPRPIIELTGIPEEIISAMNIRKLIYSTVKPFYLLMESLGMYVINDNLTKLVSDHVLPAAE